MTDIEYLYLICNTEKWGGGKTESYKINERLYYLDEESWKSGGLKNIFVGMKGIIKVSEDVRPKYLLDEHKVKKLPSGIYATFKVVGFNPKKKNEEIKIKIIDNFFSQNRIINKEKSKEILGNKFNSQRQGYISENIFNLAYEAFNQTGYTAVPKPKKKLIIEDSKEVYPRDKKEKEKALEFAKFQCEIDKTHITFTSKINNKNYVEGHHLIPINSYDKFENDVDVLENIISLCPACHRKLHSGTKNDVDELLNSLYKERKGKLDSVGLKITIDELKDIYNYDINKQ